MTDTNTCSIFIATKDPKAGLYIIAMRAISFDTIEIEYNNDMAPTVEYLLRILQKGFGWIEFDRGQKKGLIDNVCKFKKEGFCTNEKVGKDVRCTEQVRVCCPQYIAKHDRMVLKNFVTIEKAGQIRGM